MFDLYGEALRSPLGGDCSCRPFALATYRQILKAEPPADHALIHHLHLYLRVIRALVVPACELVDAALQSARDSW